jgi:hypothetical protein
MSITSANSEFTLTIPGVYAGPVIIQGFMVDDAFGSEDVTPVEARMGVDGRKTSGYTPFMTKIMVHLMPDSPSVDIFDTWNAALAAVRDDLTCQGSIMSPSLGKAWTLNNGSLTRYKQVPDAKKVFEGQTFEITLESVQVSAI